MYINKLEIENFRNYEKEIIDFHKRANLIIGKNAQGKTNLLESLYLTSLGRSFRTNLPKEMINFEKDYCRVKAEYEKNGSGVVEVALNKEGKKSIKVNGVKLDKSSQILDNVLTVIFSPEDLKIVKEEPEKRRNFIDKELCQIKFSYFDSLNNYKKILEQRNAYLKEINIDRSALEVWDEALAYHGTRIINLRAKFIKILEEISKDIHAGITGGKEVLSVKYEPNVDPESNLLEAIKNNLESDIRNRTSGKGPHKDDIKICIDGINARKFSSQGQQRTAALSLKLAEIELIRIEKKTAPVLLLDDVLSELDGSRQKYLVEYLRDIQLFIASAELSEQLKKSFTDGKIFTVKGGKIT